MVLEIKISLSLSLIIKFSFLFSQEKRILLLNEKDSTTLEGIDLYQRGFIEDILTSNDKGLIVFKSNYNSNNNLIINDYKYEYKEILFDSLNKESNVIYLREKKELIDENIIEEVVFYGNNNQKYLRNEVKFILKNHKIKSSELIMDYSVNGEHKVLENNINKFIFLKNPFEVYFENYDKIEKQRGIKCFIKEKDIYKKPTSDLLIPYYSTVFMNTIFSKINLYDIGKNIKSYNFIKYEQDGNIFYEFKPENIKSSFKYEGFLEVDGNNNIINVEFNLINYKGNIDKVISMSKRIPGSKTEYEFESTKIKFDKKGNPLEIKFKSLLSQKKENVNIQYNVDSYFLLKVINRDNTDKSKTILDYLYINPKKIKPS